MENNSQLIKKNNVAGGYTKVYPLVYIQGIYDYVTKKGLEDILLTFNHIYLPYLGTPEDTRMSLPNKYRRQGIWITYRGSSGLITEVYKGSVEDISNSALFAEDINWEIVPDMKYVQSNASKIPNGAILPDHLSPALWELLGSNNTITNLPDEEDLTQECNVLSFKDRVYDSEVGYGYKILRKNWVNGINVLKSEELGLEHTIYEIRYNFDLQGETINLPIGCTLLFKGGAINNGTVNCNGTNIIGVNRFEDAGSATYSGTFSRGLLMMIDNTIKYWDGTQWSELQSTGGSIDPNAYVARVVETIESQVATASVDIVDNEFQFKFGLPKGEKGDKGDKGDDGTIEGLAANATAQDSQVASADVQVVGTTLQFSFGLPKGEKGDKGDTGDTGPAGPQGEPGPQGPSGDVSVAMQTFIVFKSTGQSTAAPETPVGGHWNSSTNEFTPPDGWSRTDTLEGIIWMSSGIFRSDTGELIGEWTTPVRITGQDGTNGADGTNVEFIFKLTQTSLEPPYLDTTDSPNTNDYIPDGWTDSPSGISVEYQCEWVSTRSKTEDGSWSDWSEPAIWSKWGVNGTDGDGVEYIFTRNNGEAVDNPTPDDTNTDQYQERGDYENIEYVPAGWTDNPQGVSSEFKYEWVSQRKYRNGVWGAFSDPAVWAKFGDDGYSGLSLRTMYAKMDIGETPVVVRDNINPGSIWGSAFPDYDSETEAVWCIQAYVTYDNRLATTEDGASYEGWQGPWIVTGTPGKEGTPPNYKTYIYKQAAVKPDRPTSTDKIPEGWVDYPISTGQWWQCIGTVNGVTDLVTEWSEVLPVNGQDGEAQDGKRTEFRFAANNSAYVAPNLTKGVRNPSGWTTNPPQLNSGQYLWMTTAVINPNDTLYSDWTDPVRISGEQGPQGETGPAGPTGPTGSQGVSGIPGVSIEVRYCLGTETSYDGSSSPSGNSPSGWSTTIPTTTEQKPYIWCIQGRRSYSSSSDATGTIAWGTPFRLSGVNGLDGAPGADGEDGADGKRGQLVYPAGVYSNTTSYTTDENKAPYVLDTSDGNFYVLNAQMTWLGTEQNNRTPSQDYAANNGEYWLKFDAFEAIYAKIGIIANGLIGSAVFNGDYMFSQQGINPSASNATTSHYELFDPDHIYDGSFTPNILFNFNTGAGHLGAGKIKFNSDGSGSLAGDNLTWATDGTLLGNILEKPFGVIDSGGYINLPELPFGYAKTIITPFLAITRTTVSYIINCENTNAIIRYYDSTESSGDSVKQSSNGKATIMPPYVGCGVIVCSGENTIQSEQETWIVGFVYFAHKGTMFS